MSQPQRSSVQPRQPQLPAQPAEPDSQQEQPSQDSAASDANSGFVHISTGPSSQIQSINYNPKTLDLVCQFVSGATYLYHNVDQVAIGGISRADSPGKYFRENIIKGGFEYERMD